MAPVVGYRVLDELLGLEPLDWSGDFKPRFDAAVGGMREARGVRRVVAGPALPRPLAAYAGDYGHPGYGVLSITADGDITGLTVPFEPSVDALRFGRLPAAGTRARAPPALRRQGPAGHHRRVRARRHRRRHSPGRPAARHIPREAVSLERAFEADGMEG